MTCYILYKFVLFSWRSLSSFLPCCTLGTQCWWWPHLPFWQAPWDSLPLISSFARYTLPWRLTRKVKQPTTQQSTPLDHAELRVSPQVTDSTHSCTQSTTNKQQFCLILIIQFTNPSIHTYVPTHYCSRKATDYPIAASPYKLVGFILFTILTQLSEDFTWICPRFMLVHKF